MKCSSKEFLETVSRHCSNQLTYYKFNTSTLKVSHKYREGRLAALEYLGELIYYYLQAEKKIHQDFHEQIRKQMEHYSCLAENDYKQGLYDALHETLALDQKIRP